MKTHELLKPNIKILEMSGLFEHEQELERFMNQHTVKQKIN
jgi:hypothetical protein